MCDQVTPGLVLIQVGPGKAPCSVRHGSHSFLCHAKRHAAGFAGIFQPLIRRPHRPAVFHVLIELQHVVVGFQLQDGQCPGRLRDYELPHWDRLRLSLVIPPFCVHRAPGERAQVVPYPLHTVAADKGQVDHRVVHAVAVYVQEQRNIQLRRIHGTKFKRGRSRAGAGKRPAPLYDILCREMVDLSVGGCDRTLPLEFPCLFADGPLILL